MLSRNPRVLVGEFRKELRQNCVRSVVWRKNCIRTEKNVNTCRLLFGKVIK